MRRVIVTGGDARYFHLIEDLIRSVRVFRSANEMPIVVLDAGLRDTQRSRLRAAYGVRLLDVPWEYDLPIRRIAGKEHLKTQISRAFLDTYLPDYDLIAWIDADAWVQDWSAVEMLFEAASTGSLGIVAEASRYASHVIGVRWGLLGYAEVRSLLYKNARKAGVRERDARFIALRPSLNAGVFALRRDAPHWAAWRARQAQVINRARLFSSDQLSLGMAVYLDHLPVELLPDTCNYRGPWKVTADGSTLVENYLPNAPLGIVHLAGQNALRREPAVMTEIPRMGGGILLAPLRQCAWEKRCLAAVGADDGHEIARQYRHLPA